MKILNSRDVKKIMNVVKDKYGISGIKLDYVFLQDENKLFITSRDFQRVEDLKTNNVGLFFGKVVDGGIILSIEASQIIGNLALNTANIDKEEIKYWIAGYDLNTDRKNGFVFIKHNNDFFGVGKVKDNKIFNLIPRERRIYSLSSGSRQDNQV